MRIPIVIIAFVVGGWLTLDGMRALTKGDYVTARAGELGPWSGIISSLGVNPRSTGMKLVHVVLGLAWLASTALFLSRVSIALHALVGCAVLTLWYLPLGTVLSIAELVLLFLLALRGQT